MKANIDPNIHLSILNQRFPNQFQIVDDVEELGST